MQIAYKEYMHYNREMETAIIGACIIEFAAISRVYGMVESEHFYEPKNAFLFKSLQWMYQKGYSIDLLTVVQFIHTKGLKKWVEIANGDELCYYCTKATNMVVSTANIESHALIIRELYIKRLTLQIQANAGADNSIEGAIETKKLLDKAFELGHVDDWMSFEEVLTKRLIPHMDKVKGMEVIGHKTGFSSLDKHSNIQPGEFVILAARPSIGKTAIAMKIAKNIASTTGSVGVISLETQSQRLAGRIMAGETQLEYWKIWKNRMHDNEETFFNERMSRLSSLPLYISDKPSISAIDLRNAAWKLRRKCTGPMVVVIDYLQLISADENERAKTRQQEIGNISRMCRLITLDIPETSVLALCQLSRAAETDGSIKPQLRHLRESGDLEQDADKVWMLYRDRENERKLLNGGNKGPYDASLIIEKNKEGWCGEIPLLFKPEQMDYYDPGESLPLGSWQPVKNYYEVEKNEKPF